MRAWLLLLIACEEPAALPPEPPPIEAADLVLPPPLPPEPLPPEPPPIIDEPIPYGPRRERLTQDYLRAHLGADQVTEDPAADSRMVPRVIVLHWTGGGSMRSAWFTFEPERRPRRPDLHGAKALNVSSQFIVDRDGTIYRLMDADRVARHTIGLNHLSIGVENVGDGTRRLLTPAQVAANIALVRHLKWQFPTITHLIGHYEYRQFEHTGHPYFQDLERRRSSKDDPGPKFMASVRAGLEGLGLEDAPALPLE